MRFFSVKKSAMFNEIIKLLGKTADFYSQVNTIRFCMCAQLPPVYFVTGEDNRTKRQFMSSTNHCYVFTSMF